MVGRVWKFDSDIDTDAIIPGRYLVINDPEELAAHLFEGARPEMASAVRKATMWWQERTSAAALLESMLL